MSEFSAIILAGGKSSRMGQKKSMLLYHGKTFIEIIERKLAGLGIKEIMISGYEYEGNDLIYVADKYSDKGPLAGVHAGLCKSVNDSVLVVTEDAPLIPEDFILQLMNEHLKKQSMITVAECDGRIQPLIGIYDKNLASTCDEILQGKKYTVMSLIDRVGSVQVPFDGDEILIRGCNTPEEYSKMCEKSHRD